MLAELEALIAKALPIAEKLSHQSMELDMGFSTLKQVAEWLIKHRASQLPPDVGQASSLPVNGASLPRVPSVVQSALPQFGVNYFPGTIFFTRTAGLVSDAISFGERWDAEPGEPIVTHVGIVIGDNQCIEAHIETGVAKASLDKYFLDPTCEIYFRQPLGWTPELGLRIAEAAATKLGAHYDTGLIVAAAGADTYVGHLVNKVFHDWPNRVVAGILARPGSFICSQLVAWALAQQPEFAGRGILTKFLDTIDPQELMADQVILAPGIIHCLKSANQARD